MEDKYLISRFKKLANLKEDAEAEIKQLITKVKNYDEFIKQLDTLASDPKVQAFIKSGKADGEQEDDALTAASKAISVSDLRPTQNEIDVDKSLHFALTVPNSLANCLQSGTVTIKGPIVTYNGKYIIDGHHRWSQLYAVNAKAKIACTDLSGPEMDPVDILKIVQLAIAADAKKVPSETAPGQNLLTIGEDEIRKYVIKTITPECINIFKKFRSKVANINKPEGIVDNIIIPNVKLMRKTSQPVPGAPERDVMPQTGYAPNAIKNIAKGVINYNDPYKMSESIIKKVDSMLQNTIIKLKK